MQAFGFKPWSYPFLDLEAVPAAISCWSRGINVYVSNPCDALGRSGVYSPIWLWLPVLPTGPSWTAFYGVCLTLAFCASLTVLPPVKGFRDRLLLLSGLVSPAVAFAVERGNVDVLMFVGSALVVLLVERSIAFRMAGYGLALLLGLAKYYPMTILTLTLRERLGVFLAAAAISALTFCLFVAEMLAEVRAAIAANLMSPSVLTAHSEFFGVTVLAEIVQNATAGLLGAAPAAAAVQVALVLASLAYAMLLAAGLPALRRLDGLGERALNCLLVGSLLFAGCFLAGPSLAYRATLLLFVLPSVLILAHGDGRSGGAWFWFGVALLILAQLWMLRFGMIVVHRVGWLSVSGGRLGGPPAAFAFLAFREAVGWVLATLCLSFVTRWAFRSRAATDALALLRRAPTPRSPAA